MSKKVFTLPYIPFFFIVFLLSVMCFPIVVNAAPQIQILTSHTSFIDSIGYFNVVGEVHNVGDQAAEDVFITATLYNAGNQVVGTPGNRIALPVLLPDRKSPFRVEFVDISQSALVDHYSLEVEFTPTDSIPKQLQITSHSSSIDVGFSLFEILGEVENTGDSTAMTVSVFATCYDEAGKVVQVGGAYTEPVDIGVNQKSPFRIWIDPDNFDLINSYTLTAASENYALIPEFNSVLLAILAVSLVAITLLLYKRKIIKN